MYVVVQEFGNTTKVWGPFDIFEEAERYRKEGTFQGTLVTRKVWEPK